MGARSGGLAFFAAVALASILPAAAQEPRRDPPPHEHGRGTLNIAIEGNKVSMELDTPGMDILGFEHAATTAAQKRTVKQAETTLSRPLALFKLPAAAGCRVREANVAIEAEEHDHHGADKGQGAESKGEPGAAAKEEHADHAAHPEHSDVHAEYVLQCTAPAAITRIDFDYFKVFKGAERLDVNVITSKGQSRFEVSRDKPRLDLGGLV